MDVAKDPSLTPLPSFEDVLRLLCNVHQHELDKLVERVRFLESGGTPDKVHVGQVVFDVPINGGEGCELYKGAGTINGNDINDINVAKEQAKLDECNIMDDNLPGTISSSDPVPAASSDLFRLRDLWTMTVNNGTSLSEAQLVLGSQRRDAQALPTMRMPDSCRRTSLVAAGNVKVKASLAKHGVVMSPNCAFRLWWDVMGLVLISYDLIMIPFSVFEPDPNVLSLGMEWVARVFWTGDMIMGFFTGYFEGGNLVMSPPRVCFHYMRTWLLPDLVVVGSDWMALLSKSVSAGDSSGMGVSRIFRSSRAVRVLRLLRLLKLQRMFNIVYDMIENEVTFLWVSLLKLLGFVLVLNHVIACLWFLIGKVGMDQSRRNWIEVGEVDRETIGYKYTTALHWSLTQFTPASMDISARNEFERVFSIIVLFFAMVAFSSVVASITGSMTSIRGMKGDDMKQFWMLRKYLRQSKTPKELSQRIVKYLEHQTQLPSVVSPVSIKIISKLSEPLQQELNAVVHSPFLKAHPFFTYVANFMSVAMHGICSKALGARSFAADDVCFTTGEEARVTIFVKSGDLQYYHPSNHFLNPPPSEGEWAVEAVMWVDWRHHGVLRAVSPSDLITLHPAAMSDVLRLHPRPYIFTACYGKRYVDFINGSAAADLSDFMRHPEFYEEAVQGSISDANNMGGRDAWEDRTDFSDPEVGRVETAEAKPAASRTSLDL